MFCENGEEEGGFSLQYKRNEILRYTFVEPIYVKFLIVKIGDRVVKSQPGAGSILDISPSGLRLKTNVKLPPEKEVDLDFTFALNDMPVSIVGHLVWGKQYGENYEYGVRLYTDEQEEQLILKEMKHYAKNEQQ